MNCSPICSREIPPMKESEIVDLRSDTVTKPTPAMRRALANAEVGDDVYGEDPTVARLEERAAALVGHEASLFVPTGTMGNQIAVNIHTRPGTDVLLESGSHVYLYELGAMAAWSGALARPIAGRDGMLDRELVARAVAPDVYYLAPATLVVLENSHNHAGGRVMPPDLHHDLVAGAHDLGLRVHLDGARIFNSAIALGVDPRELAEGVDSVMFCLSKGLGAPVGSMLCGSRDLISQARVVRKRMGGGMRQAGILAAAALHALEHHIELLRDDHARAARLAEAVAESPLFELDPSTVETNIVIATLREPESSERVLEELKGRGVLAGAMGAGRIRFVTHLDIDDAALARAVEALRDLHVQ
jgi:threonine aldolase